MPRASWRGFLRLSLVSCPIYLSPATTRTKPIRLHQVWQPAPVEVDEDDLPGRGGEQQGSERSVPRLRADGAAPDGEQSPAATRITLRPHDPGTGEEIEKREVVKGYEYSRGQFLTFTAEELKALDVESSKVVDLEKFVAGSDIDPVYFDSPYHVHPDGPIVVEVLRVIGAAMAQAGVVGLGRLTLSRRERMVMVHRNLLRLEGKRMSVIAQGAKSIGSVRESMTLLAQVGSSFWSVCLDGPFRRNPNHARMRGYRLDLPHTGPPLLSVL